MTEDAGRPALATDLAATVQRDHEEGERARQYQEARRAVILARYGSARTALLPCPREVALRDATWRHVVPGDASTGPTLMGWKDGPAGDLQPHVRDDVAATIRMPATPAEALAEYQHWEHRDEVHEVLGGGGLPLWVRARRAVLDAHIEAMIQAAPDGAAREEWRQSAEQDPDARQASPAPAEAGRLEDSAPTDGSPDPDGQAAPVQSGQGARTREEAREAVRALLVEDLTDREIARRIGVSPSTVGAVRKAAGLPSQGSLR